MNQDEIDDDLPSEDPVPHSSPSWLFVALRELAENYPDGSTTAHRREIGVRLGFEPKTIFGALSRKRFIAKAHIHTDSSLRVVTPDGHKWLADPSVATGVFYSRYVAAISAELGRRAIAGDYRVEEKSPHVLADTGAWTTALWPLLRAIANEWIAQGDRHKWIHNLRSSQAFAVNMLGPLKLALPWARDLWRDRFGDVTDVDFEYPKKGDPLQEMSVRGSRTRIDVREHSKDRGVTLIEVKLSEPEFGACSSGGDSMNPYRAESCETPFESFEALNRTCYLAREAKRNYFVQLGRSTSQIDPIRIGLHGKTQCPLRGGLYQLARNLLMARHIAESERCETRVLILAPGARLHPILHKHRAENALRDELRSILKQGRQEDLDVVAFESLVDAAENHGPEARHWAAHMTHWYIQPLQVGAAAIAR